LQHTVTQLTVDNTTLKHDNKALTDEIKAEQQMNENINKISKAGDEQREINKKHRDSQLKKIDDSVKAGKDRPVGPLLKEFFNG
jgi:uncharacterized membrane protein YgaE (UPF0421/DUF939 family)